MPHLVVEYSAGLEGRCDIRDVAKAAHAVLVAQDIFPTAGIRVRFHRADVSIVADGLEQNDFLAMTLSVAAGRAPEALKAAGEALFSAVQAVLAEPLSGEHFALSLEIREINPQLSWKDTPIHARLSGKS